MRKAARAAGWTAAAFMAAAVFPAQAQGRLSLAERVERLERVAAEGDRSTQNVELLNRISELQSEIQSLRGLVEEQGFEIESLKKRGRDQYLDLDARLTRLEGGTPPASTEPPAEPLFEEPEVRPPADAGTETAPVAAVEPAPAETVSDPAGERDMYDSAFDALKQGRYAEAARRFQSFLASYPSGSYAPNAMYWLGESYYVTQNYQIALDTFRQLLATFPQSAKAPDALLKVGYCQYELRQWNEAEATLQDVVQRYPDSTVSRLAQGRLRALRLESRQ